MLESLEQEQREEQMKKLREMQEQAEAISDYHQAEAERRANPDAARQSAPRPDVPAITRPESSRTQIADLNDLNRSLQTGRERIDVEKRAEKLIAGVADDDPSEMENIVGDLTDPGRG